MADRNDDDDGVGQLDGPILFICAKREEKVEEEELSSTRGVAGQWRAANQSTYWVDTPWRPHVPNEHIIFLIDESFYWPPLHSTEMGINLNNHY